MLLGSVSPALVKYAVQSLDENGRVVGELNALNTIGSIIGTFAPTFITIPLVGTAWTFLIFAAILIAIALTFFISSRRSVVKTSVISAVAIAVALLGTRTGFAFWQTDGIYEDESIYNYLQVTEDEEEIVLSTNVLFGVQSKTQKDGRLTGMYYDYALAAPYMVGADSAEECDVLILGMGTGTYATQCRRYFPSTDIVGVEIDKKIIELAYDRFGLSRDDDRIECVEFDGRAYLESAGKYDIIMVDAYRDITIPFQMSSIEFFREVREHLNEGGVMIVNLNMRSDSQGSINEYICDTVAAVFDTVYTADCGGNREVFASDSPDIAQKFRTGYPSASPELARLMANVDTKLCEYSGGELILTDDKAPVELLGMQVIDEVISEELAYYKKLFKGKSISELLDMLK
jgi:spermidine synthase